MKINSKRSQIIRKYIFNYTLPDTENIRQGSDTWFRYYKLFWKGWLSQLLCVCLFKLWPVCPPHSKIKVIFFFKRQILYTSVLVHDNLNWPQPEVSFASGSYKIAKVNRAQLHIDSVDLFCIKPRIKITFSYCTLQFGFNKLAGYLGKKRTDEHLYLIQMQIQYFRVIHWTCSM